MYRNDSMTDPANPASITLGILAGGRATRLGGIDKAWLERDGVPQVLRPVRALGADVGHVLVSANRDTDRYAAHGLRVAVDRVPGLGPIAGLHALSVAASTPWLITVPVDVWRLDGLVLPALVSAGPAGAYAIDDDGVQPLLALWPVEALRTAVEKAIRAEVLAIHSLQDRLGMAGVRFDGLRFGNLNTPADLAAAGIHCP